MRNLKNLKPFILLTVVVFALSMLVTGCTSSDSDKDSASNNGSGLEGKILVLGSSPVAPLAQELADSFTDKEQDVEIDVQGPGSSQGVKAISDGTTDIGMSSRELTSEEEGLGLTKHVIAYDGIAVIVNPENKVSDLTNEQIAKIFKGEIKNWKDVGGEDSEIIVVTREDGSGTRKAFEEILKLEEKGADGKKHSLIRNDSTTIITSETGVEKATVVSKKNAIGYVSLGALDKTVKTLKVDGIEANSANVKSKTYPIWRPFLMLTKGEAKPIVKAYLDFIMSDEGQKVVSKEFVSVK